MSPKVVRALAMLVFFGFGIPGMIIASIGDNAGAAVTFGLITASVALVLIVASAITSGRPVTADVEAEGAALEARVQAMVHAGADEQAVRELVRDALQMGRRTALR